MVRLLKKIVHFYIEGFRNMGIVGRRLWLIIGIKLVIMFLIFRLLFFKNFLNDNFETDSERSDYVIEQLTR